ncbi:MAG: 4-(cytidine 5'-diphospho)-2-C-methyl-D-erythritol kinase [Candidatus Bipolaricaulota bacterium]
MDKATVKSFAKINPSLKINGVRPDGYHELQVSYLSVSLGDVLTFTPASDQGISVTGLPEVPPAENLCRLAAEKLRGRATHPTGIHIHIEKRIPIGRGLGGGSGNAAATLAVLNELWNCDLSSQKLDQLAAELGADVPFFLRGGYCKAAGVGDELHQEPNPYRDRLLGLLIPPFSLQTPKVYRRYDQLKNSELSSRDIPAAAEKFSSDPSYLKNDLLKPALSLRPELANFLNLPYNFPQVNKIGMSGSGSAVFVILQTDEANLPQQFLEELSRLDGKFELIRSTSRGFCHL